MSHLSTVMGWPYEVEAQEVRVILQNHRVPESLVQLRWHPPFQREGGLPPWLESSSNCHLDADLPWVHRVLPLGPHRIQPHCIAFNKVDQKGCAIHMDYSMPASLWHSVDFLIEDSDASLCDARLWIHFGHRCQPICYMSGVEPVGWECIHIQNDQRYCATKQ